MEGRFANERMRDRLFQARFEAKMRFIGHLKIKVEQTLCRLVLERRGSESQFSWEENLKFPKFLVGYKNSVL